MTPNPTAAEDPATVDEKSCLLTSLNRHRDAILWKLRGLDEEQLRRPMTPSGSNLIGLLKHLASVEYGWFCETFGREVEPLWFDPATEQDMSLTEGETPDQIFAFHARARTAADAVITELPLDALGTSWRGVSVSLRWVLVHMVEEVARHAGHIDILRELIDGATGDHNRS
ncbi:DinB family protein [Streptomyces sp. NA04227]|uniref:DinB family protein n=1 Tax=Streptomyces sp. NA04227 TaxID=2742136 RepID=UPI001590CCB1|nr:DinB family protein [Streptomyces sp. NA04227]QKW08880.1 DinB family protein [Streptomyces sp. NA04227]